MSKRLPSPELLASPENLFVVGGEELRPFYPQPGITPQERWSFCIPYLSDSASVENLQHDHSPQEIAANLAMQAAGIQRVYSSIPDALRIEAERKQLTDTINRIPYEELIYSGKFDKLFSL